MGPIFQCFFFFRVQLRDLSEICIVLLMLQANRSCCYFLLYRLNNEGNRKQRASLFYVTRRLHTSILPVKRIFIRLKAAPQNSTMEKKKYVKI
jgi:hypothetical protein